MHKRGTDPPVMRSSCSIKKSPSGQMGDRYVELVELEGEEDDFSLLLGVDSLFVSLFDSPFDSLFDSLFDSDDEGFDPLPSPSPFDFPLRA
jgi:hypothetical protein